VRQVAGQQGREQKAAGCRWQGQECMQSEEMRMPSCAADTPSSPRAPRRACRRTMSRRRFSRHGATGKREAARVATYYARRRKDARRERSTRCHALLCHAETIRVVAAATAALFVLCPPARPMLNNYFQRRGAPRRCRTTRTSAPAPAVAAAVWWRRAPRARSGSRQWMLGASARGARQRRVVFAVAFAEARAEMARKARQRSMCVCRR